MNVLISLAELGVVSYKCELRVVGILLLTIAH